MKLNIVDANRFIKVNELQEVSNPIYFDRGRQPTDDGLFSYVIFGRPGSKERAQKFAYIDLKSPFLHPLVYKTLIRLDRKFEQVVAGQGSWIINKAGQLEESYIDEASTGLDFLFKNWKNIVHKKTESVQRMERVNFLNNFDTNNAFLTKQIVIPAQYRDIDFANIESGKVAHDEINDKYAKLLRLVASMRLDDDGDFMGTGLMTKFSIQNTLIDIYDYFMNKLKKKRGILRQAVMGKSVDYGIRSVISASQYNMESYKDLKVTFEKSGVPLTQCLVAFFPFTMKYLQDFFEAEFGKVKHINRKNPKTGQIERIALSPDCMVDFEYDKLQKKVDQFVKAPTNRFEVIQVKTEKGYMPLRFVGSFRDEADAKSNSSSISNRYLTWTDLFYMCAVEITRDKCVYITRYPMEDYFGCYPTEVSVLSTFKTAPQIVNGVEYPFYPVIDLNTPKEKIPGLFIDSLQLFNAMLSAIGGDFDGDQVTLRGVFTQEANIEAKKLIHSPSNILTIRGDNNRTISNEAVQALYGLTKD